MQNNTTEATEHSSNNLHFKCTIRFYTRGRDAVELTDKDGLIYLIGSQKAEELSRVINNKLN